MEWKVRERKSHGLFQRIITTTWGNHENRDKLRAELLMHEIKLTNTRQRL